jgi:cytochrome c oxidase subunit 3
MVIIILFMTGAVAVALWWLARQGLMTKPWLEQSTVGDVPATGASSLPAAKIGLGMFLTVAGSLFALLVSAYAMRMAMPDWRALPMPILLWINTGALVVSSAALQCAQGAARRQDLADVRTGLLAGGAGAMVFLAGQLLAWQQLNALGYFLATNPANAFFYLLTAVHGVHVAGLARRPAGPAAPERRAVHDVLAFPAAGLAGAAGPADGLGGPLRRDLPPAAELGEG